MKYQLKADQNLGVEILSAHLEEGAPVVGLFAATGMGKSLTALATALLNTKGHIFVLVPRNAIASSWAKYKGTIEHTKEDGSTVVLPIPPIELINSTSDYKGSLVPRLVGFIQKPPETEESRRIIILHYGTAREAVQNNPTVLKNLFSIFDEGHHVPQKERGSEEGFSFEGSSSWKDIRICWEKNGGRAILATATPDQEDLKSLKDCKFESSVCELMLDGRAPQHIYFDTVYSEEESLRIARMVDNWVEDGRPAAVVRIMAPEKKPENERRLKAILEAFEVRSEGTSILDVSYDQGEINLTRVLNAYNELESRNLPKDFESLPRVLVGFDRASEGVDLPWVSHVYFFGMPGSTRAMDQTVGRALRDKKGKFENYPEPWVNAAKIIVVTPTDLRKRSPDETWVHLCLRLVSYRNALSLVQEGDNLGSGRARDKCRPNAVLHFRASYIASSLQKAIEFARKHSSKTRTTFGLKDIPRLASFFLKQDHERLSSVKRPNYEQRQQLKALSTEDGGFDQALFLKMLRAAMPKNEGEVPNHFEGLIDPSDIQLFRDRATVERSETLRKADGKLMHELEGTSYTDIEILAWLRVNGWPSWSALKKTNPDLARYLKVERGVFSSTGVGTLAVSLVYQDRPWPPIFGDLEMAGSGLRGIAKQNPVAAYFDKARHLHRKVQEATYAPLATLTLEEAHNLVSAWKVKDLETLLSEHLSEPEFFQKLKGGSRADPT